MTGIVLNLEDDESKWIDSDNEAFIDTPFEGKPFRVRVTPVSSVKLSRANRAATTRDKRGQESRDDVVTQRALFIECVQEWEGILGNDNKPIACTTENKKAIADKYMDLAGAVVVAAMRCREIKEAQEAAALGN